MLYRSGIGWLKEKEVAMLRRTDCHVSVKLMYRVNLISKKRTIKLMEMLVSERDC